MKIYVVSLCFLLSSLSQALTLMTWNIHRGVGADGKMDLARIAAVIRAAQPDAVVLQEVDQGTTRSQGVKQADELARLLGWQLFFGKAINFQGGEYGQAVLSKWPIEEKKIHRLSEAGEARVAIEVLLKTAQESVTVVGVHLDAESEPRRMGEIKVLLNALAATKGKMIVAGDWNQAPDGEMAPLMKAAGLIEVKKTGKVMTCPQDKPTAEIDHLWSKGFTPEGKAQVVDGNAASDHLPVVAVWGKVNNEK